MERAREAYWLRYPNSSPIKLRWRAQAARHTLHIAPGDQILEFGAGSGLWTEHLASVHRGESEITAAVFDQELADQAASKRLPGVDILPLDTAGDLPRGGYDHLLGTTILSHDRYQENLAWLHSLLRPGGQILFFEADYWMPRVFVKTKSRRPARGSGNARCQLALRRASFAEDARTQGFTDIQVSQYDILHPRTPRKLIPAVQSSAFVLEHLPVVRRLCGTLLLRATKSGPVVNHRPVDLVRHVSLANAVSVVVPCHNEAMNIPRLVRSLTALYDGYIREIVLVDDNSTDDTIAVAQGLARQEPRVRLVSRKPPAGVGRALRDGYAAARGKYILSIDCDFAMLVPELRDLFETVASGREGAIGSRFSHESVLVEYPPAKLLGNRAFHLLVRLLLRKPVHDISNNLKLYRADILRRLEIKQDGFAANAETGLRPLLDGRDIEEVPIGWINRNGEMGASTFRVARVAPGYALVLLRLLCARIVRRLR